MRATFFAQIWLYLLATGAGLLIGYLVLTALGRDYRSQQLKRYAEVKARQAPAGSSAADPPPP